MGTLKVFCGPRDVTGEADVLYRNNGDGTFTDVTVAAGIKDPGYYGFGVVFSDFDNDGWLDLFVANGHVYPQVDQLKEISRYLQPKELYRNLGDGRFAAVAAGPGSDLVTPRAARGVAFGDYDNDGDVDVL